MTKMRAVVFRGKGQIGVEEVPKPVPGPGEAVIKISATTICGTDVHIVRGEYPVKPGLVLGHEPVGVVEELGAGLGAHYKAGERVIVGAITPCGQCFYCLNGSHSQCGGPLGGWRFGNTINGAWAEYLLVPDARANLATIPGDLGDESVLMCPDIFSTACRVRRAAISGSAMRSRFSRRARSVCAPRLARNCGAPDSSLLWIPSSRGWTQRADSARMSF
jgi:alcohol dehydrogenase